MQGKIIKTKIGFIGAGTVGTAIATGLNKNGYKIVAVSSRSLPSANNLAQTLHQCFASTNNQDVANAADLVFVTTPDDAIAPVVSKVRWRAKQSVVHCSGADSTVILEPAKKAGANVGVLHPLQTFASIKNALVNMPGSTFAIEAEEPLLSILKDMTTTLGGHWIKLKTSDKVLYHASAVIACNYLVTLIKLSTDLWQTFNIPAQEATQALLPLIRGTINNIETTGIPKCLTGPVARGDSGTIKKHLEALKKSSPSLLPTYRELGLQTIPISLAKGKITEQQAHELETLLRKPKPKNKG